MITTGGFGWCEFPFSSSSSFLAHQHVEFQRWQAHLQSFIFCSILILFQPVLLQNLPDILHDLPCYRDYQFKIVNGNGAQIFSMIHLYEKQCPELLKSVVILQKNIEIVLKGSQYPFIHIDCQESIIHMGYQHYLGILFQYITMRLSQ